MIVKAQIQIPRLGRGAHGTQVFNTVGQRVLSYSIDTAMDTDTDDWMISLGIEGNTGFAQDMLDRDAEVRCNIYGFGGGQTESLHSGFADVITLDEQGTMNIQGRDITAVAVDSQHPPQIWHGIRPEILVAKEARLLRIGDRLNLTKAPGFKTYATDGSESYWEVWYRFYRKRRMWLWADSLGSLNAMTLHYNQPISYYFGMPGRPTGVRAASFIPVEQVEWRSNKQQRVGEVLYFGHRGDIGFLCQAVDPATRMWIKRPNLIISSGDAHNQAEARVEAWEEIFESKVGAVEIKLTVANPGFFIKQDRMAFVNLPKIGLVGEYYVVGAQLIGSNTGGIYQVIRLREKNYAISRRVPTDPSLKSGSATAAGGETGVTANLSTAGPSDWNEFFVAAANKFHGPWNFSLFLGVLLSICEQETGFRNERRGGNIEYPGTSDGSIPALRDPEHKGAYSLFQRTFANEAGDGIVTEDYAVGPMQLLTEGFKLYADRLSGSGVGDELLGGRWDPESNIMAGAAALASKLGAGVSISPSGVLKRVPISGLSLQPDESNIWQGVADYGEGKKYALEVRARYNQTYKASVASAVSNSRAEQKQISTEIPAGSSAELRKRVLNNTQITFTRQSQKDDISSGQIVDDVLKFLLWFTEAGWPVTITALKSDHTIDVFESGKDTGRRSAHGMGKAVDLGNYDYKNAKTNSAMEYIGIAQPQLGFAQLIGPNPQLVIPKGIYDEATLAAHKSHIHVGW